MRDDRQNKKIKRIDKLIIRELESNDFKAKGYEYLISLISSIPQNNELIPTGNEIAQQILESIKNIMPENAIFAKSELTSLVELLVAPIEQRAMFNFNTSYKELTHPQYYFCKVFWKELLKNEPFGDRYLAKLRHILWSGVNISINGRYNIFTMKKDIVQNYVYCPFFIASFILRWIVLKDDSSEQDILTYNKIVKSVEEDKIVSFIFYYILFELVTHTYKYTNDVGTKKLFIEKDNFITVQKYVADTNLQYYEQDDTLIIPKHFVEKIKCIFETVGKFNELQTDIFDYVDTNEVELISEINSIEYWNNKRVVVNKILERRIVTC